MKISDLGLPINLPIRLYRSADKEQFFTVKLLGMVDGKSLIISAPISESGNIILLQATQGLSIKFVWKDTIFSCQTSVLVKQSQPFVYYHLAIPSTIEMQEIRANPRVVTALDVHVLNISEQQGTQSATVTDLSAGGMRLESLVELGMIDDFIGVSMRLDVHQLRKNVKLKCQICSISIKNENNIKHFHYGIKVVEGSTDDMIALNAFVYQCKLEALKIM